MKFATARKFWCRAIRLIEDGSPDLCLPNPAVEFTAAAKAGEYDSLSDEEYMEALEDVEQLSALWNGTDRCAAGTLLLNALSRTRIDNRRLERIANQLAACSVGSQYIQQKNGHSGSAQRRDMPFTDRTECWDSDALGEFSPQAIYDYLCQRVLGQDEAKRAAAMVLYNHIGGRRSNAVFCGPTGCGKSEIWRHLKKQFPGLIRIVDTSRFAADGWKGGFHLRDIFEGIPAEDLDRNGLIVVLDEADKVCCETIIGGNGTDHSALTQNSLLKMLDGDVIEFGAGANSNEPSLRVDCQKVSVVLLGAFERLMQGKGRRSGGIGFGVKAPVECDYSNTDIEFSDLIDAGMRREIAGRINRIVSLRPLSEDDYKAILMGPVLHDLQAPGKYRVELDDGSAEYLARQAVEKNLGVRWMRSQVMNAVDDQMFFDHQSSVYIVKFPPETGQEPEPAVRMAS